MTRIEGEGSGRRPSIELADDDGGPAEAFGVWLRRQREGREIDLREIAETSKISMRYLQALETGRFDLLPARVFAKGFLRQYARYVGLDPEEVVNAFLAACDEAEGDEDEKKQDPPPSSAVGWEWIVAIVVVIALLIALVAWLGKRAAGEDREGRGGDSGAVVQAPVGQPTATAASRPAAAVAPPGPEDPERTVEAAPDTPRTEIGEAGGGGDAERETPPREDEESAVDPSADLRVVVDFLGASWVEATIDGEPTVAKMGVQGESLTLEADSTIVLKVGNAGVVEVEVDGRPWPIEPGDGPVRTWTFQKEADGE